MTERKGDREHGCPYLDKKDIEDIVEKTSNRVIQRFHTEVFPQMREEVYKDFVKSVYADLGEEAFKVGRSFLIKFLYMLGAAIIVVTSWLSIK